jgi:hypothetical protein
VAFRSRNALSTTLSDPVRTTAARLTARSAAGLRRPVREDLQRDPEATKSTVFIP